jgi:hypothetical protein
MASEEVNWVDVQGLFRAADGIDAQGRKQFEILSRLYTKVNLIDPAVFGDDKGGREFYAKWSTDVKDWDEGVRTVMDSTIATGYGVTNMARAFKSADDDTTDMADSLDKYLSDGLPPLGGNGGGGGGGGTPNQLPNPGGGGGGGGGNSGGGHSGHH